MPNAPLPLPISEVHLWSLDLTGGISRARRAAWEELMTASERQRYQRYHFEANRLEHLGARALVRGVLSAYRPAIAPEQWEFTSGPNGRPEATRGADGLSFNLSHADGRVVLVVAEGCDVGVDVERLDRVVYLEIAHHYFSSDERIALLSLPPALQPRRFLDLWTLKESYIKAKGAGLSLPLQKFGFVFDGARRRLCCDPSLGDNGDDWQTWQVDLGAYLIAISARVVDARSRDLLIREAMPGEGLLAR